MGPEQLPNYDPRGLLEDLSRAIFQIKLRLRLSSVCVPQIGMGSGGMTSTERVIYRASGETLTKWHDIHGPMQLCGGIISHKTRRVREDTGTLLAIASAAFHQEEVARCANCCMR